MKQFLTVLAILLVMTYFAVAFIIWDVAWLLHAGEWGPPGRFALVVATFVLVCFAIAWMAHVTSLKGK